MKISRSFIALIVTVLFLSTFASAQDMKPLIAADASLAQTQAWLSKTIDKNSTYKSGKSTTDSISAVKFDGCKLSYKIERESKVEYDNGPWTQEGDNSRSPLVAINITTFSFDLKDMDIGGIILTPLVAGSNMQLVELKSRKGVQGVNYALNTGNPRFNKSGLQFAATMAIKNEVAEQVKAGLVRAITLCQSGN